MAWFDILQALGQGAAQGAQTYQTLKTQQEALARANRLEARQEQQLTRQIENEDRTRALAELKDQDPLNLDPTWVQQNAKYVQPFIRKGTGGTWEVKMSEQDAKRMRLEKLQTEGALTDLEQRTGAKTAIKASDFLAKSPEARMQTLLEAGIAPEQFGPYFSPTELRQLAGKSPKFLQELMLTEMQVGGRLKQAQMEAAAAAGRAGTAASLQQRRDRERAFQQRLTVLDRAKLSGDIDEEQYATAVAALEQQYGAAPAPAMGTAPRTTSTGRRFLITEQD